MVKDLIKPLESSFLSCEKDFETILNRLFIEDKKFARELKKLLVVMQRLLYFMDMKTILIVKN